MKKSKFVPFLVASLLTGTALYRSDGFSPSHLVQIPQCSSYSYDSTSNPTIEKILQQKFRYLASGRQSFAFESEDGKWVLKIINQSRFYLSPIFLQFPLPSKIHRWLEEKSQRREERVSAFFRSFLLAYTKLQKETALQYIHFSNEEAPLVSVTSPTKVPTKVDLSHCWFVLQRKGESFSERLQTTVSSPVKWSETLSSFFHLVMKRSKKGILDDDLNVMGNVAFLNDRAFLIDPGRIYESSKKMDRREVQNELRKSSKQLKQWIYKNQPEKILSFEEEYQKAVNSL